MYNRLQCYCIPTGVLCGTHYGTCWRANNIVCLCANLDALMDTRGEFSGCNALIATTSLVLLLAATSRVLLMVAATHPDQGLIVVLKTFLLQYPVVCSSRSCQAHTYATMSTWQPLPYRIITHVEFGIVNKLAINFCNYSFSFTSSRKLFK